MKKNKILFILPSLIGGGAERVIVNIINSLDKEKFNIHLILVQNKGVYFDNLSKEIELKVFDYKKVILSFFGIRKELKKINPDIVFSTTHRMNFILSIVNKTFTKKFPIILRLPNSPKLEIENNQLTKIQQILYTYAYKNANYVIAQTPEMAQEINTYFNVERKKIKILLNPIDKKLIDKSIKNIKNPFDEKFINVVAAGRLTHQKGFDVLIQSFRYIIDKNKNFRLHIIGQASNKIDEKKLLQLVNSLQLQKYINFLGFQENPYRYFYFSDLYVLSSRWEGLPNTVLENLYLKKPIVSTRCIPFMETLITHNKTGFLVNIENSIELAKAILNYKKIQPTNSIIVNNDINRFFINIIKEKK